MLLNADAEIFANSGTSSSSSSERSSSSELLADTGLRQHAGMLQRQHAGMLQRTFVCFMLVKGVYPF